MSDRSSGSISFRQAWRPLERRAAVAAGSFVALVSLVHHVPVSVASLRGAGAFAAVFVVMKVGCLALESSLASDLRAREGDESQEP